METEPASVVAFLAIPQEVTEHILKFCHLSDVVHVAETCHDLHELICNSPDQYLWRELFLSYPFDDPRKSTARRCAVVTDWMGELRARMQAKQAVLAGASNKHVSLQNALGVLVSAVEFAAPCVEGKPNVESANFPWVRDILLRSPVLNDTTLTEPAERQLRARLRCYLGLSHEDGGTLASSTRLQLIRTASRAYVYDLRKYSRETHWGPYTACDEQLILNWEHLEHIMNVVLMNMRDLPLEQYGTVWSSWGLEATRACSAPSTPNRKAHDWAGVEGKWRRMVCFMDYRDLFAFNFSEWNNGPRNPTFFNDGFAEAIRLIEVDLEVLDLDSSPSKFDDPEHPPIVFKGTSHGMHGSIARIEGSVRMFANGVIRWNFITGFDNSHNRWSAEAVQLGNVCSAVGIGGIWTVAVHEEGRVGDPAGALTVLFHFRIFDFFLGPFWMWKASEPLPDDLLILPQ